MVLAENQLVYSLVFCFFNILYMNVKIVWKCVYIVLFSRMDQWESCNKTSLSKGLGFDNEIHKNHESLLMKESENDIDTGEEKLNK